MNLRIFEAYLCARRVWYIYDYDNYSSNFIIAKKMNILITNFIDIMKTQYNAFTFGDLNSLYFKTKEDAGKALDWIESTIIAYKLSKGYN